MVNFSSNLNGQQNAIYIQTGLRNSSIFLINRIKLEIGAGSVIGSRSFSSGIILSLRKEDRLNLRGTDLQEKIKERLNKAKIEASQKNKFDVVIMNENIDSACEKISSTVNKFLSK